ncbi:MAG: flagellar basal-body MS-ring/collar protein FliF [Vibrio sp.]
MATEAASQVLTKNNNKTVTTGNNNKLQDALGKFKSFWSSSQRNLVIITIFSTISAAIIVIMLWASSERFRPLYSSSSNYDSSQVLQLLDQSGLRYELNQDNGQIMVPEDEVAKTRMILAAKGLKQQLPSGFDALDSKETLGESQFMETARYRHALEGELARSIVTMDAVSVARVHLAIPKESLFARKDGEQARASVMVNIINGMDLKPSQVDSVINLVSGAIIGLKAENVSVVDQYGRLLSTDANSGDISVATNKQSEYRKNLEKHLVSQAADMLTPILGASNFRVQVAADMDFSSRRETEESYSNPIVRTESLLSDSKDSSLALGIPGALSNTPPVTGEQPAPQPDSSNKRSESKRDYAVSGKVSHVQHQQGVLNKFSVSIVVNETASGAKPWTPEQLRNMENVVKSAIGFNAERGDVINITSFPFVTVDAMADLSLPWYEDASIIQPLKYVLGVLLSALLIMMVLRPLAQYLTKSSDLEIGVEGENEDKALANNLTREAPSSEGLHPELQAKLNALGIDAAGIKALDDNLPSPDSPLEVQIKHLKLIAQQDPARVAEIMKTWMHA